MLCSGSMRLLDSGVRLSPSAGADHPITEALVFVERMQRRKCLSALRTLDLTPAVGVHALVAAQVRELGVRLQGESGEW